MRRLTITRTHCGVMLDTYQRHRRDTAAYLFLEAAYHIIDGAGARDVAAGHRFYRTAVRVGCAINRGELVGATLAFRDYTLTFEAR